MNCPFKAGVLECGNWCALYNPELDKCSFRIVADNTGSLNRILKLIDQTIREGN